MLTSWSILPLILSIAVTSVYPAPYQKRADHESEDEAAQALKSLFKGHDAFLEGIKNGPEPDLLQTLTDKGQHPDFAFLGCSDSRVSESAVFAAKPGTLFTTRNIANIYSKADTSVQSFLGYGVNALGVRHVIVMGHYGCGGVAGAIVEGSKKLDGPAADATVGVADAAVKAWIEPIVELYQSSSRSEIVTLRENNAKSDKVEAPAYTDPGFRAVVEENVKRSARSIYLDPIVQNHFVQLHAQASSNGTDEHAATQSEHGAKLVPVFIHSWVYDIRSGEISDLDQSFGPSGYKIPMLKDLISSA